MQTDWLTYIFMDTVAPDMCGRSNRYGFVKSGQVQVISFGDYQYVIIYDRYVSFSSTRARLKRRGSRWVITIVSAFYI
jgi:hypothetical protein